METNSIAEQERHRYLEHLLSIYDNSLSAHAIQYIIDHSTGFSLEDLRDMFDRAYLCMLYCKDNGIEVESFQESDMVKQLQYKTVARFITDRAQGVK